MGSHTLGVHQWQQELQSGENIRPGVSQGNGAVFRQILLTQEGVETQHPWVLHTLSKNPDMAGALHIIGAADQPGRPFHQPLQVNVVAERQRGLREGQWRRCKHSRKHSNTLLWQRRSLTESETAT